MARLAFATKPAIAAALAIALALGGCDRGASGESADPPPEQAEQAEQAPAQTESAPEPDTPGETSSGSGESASPAPASWTPIDEESLTEEQSAALERAREARGELARRLLSRVTSVVQQDGHAEAIDVCHLEAPELTAAAAREHEIRIGRTSHRLRNPENAPPDWASEYVDDKREAPVLLRGPEGRIAELTPIHLAEPCVGCHGSSEELAPGVAEQLAALYPEDRATGFSAGDLRGWFWVETR